jgi:hypothetical protein
MKYILCLTALLVTMPAAQAEPIVCGEGNSKGYVLQSTLGQIENDPSEITFKAWGKVPRNIRINFVWDTKTSRGSLNGKPCFVAGGM